MTRHPLLTSLISAADFGLLQKIDTASQITACAWRHAVHNELCEAATPTNKPGTSPGQKPERY